MRDHLPRFPLCPARADEDGKTVLPADGVRTVLEQQLRVAAAKFKRTRDSRGRKL